MLFLYIVRVKYSIIETFFISTNRNKQKQLHSAVNVGISRRSMECIEFCGEPKAVVILYPAIHESEKSRMLF